MTDNTDEKPWLFKPGQSANPAGRPKGSRNKLGEKFLSDLHDLWKEQGEAILQVAAAEDASAFARMVAGLLPKEAQLEVTVTHHDAKQRLGRKLHAIVESSTAPEPPVVTH